MKDKETCIHACFEELGENKWCIDCGALEASPAPEHRYINWKHTVANSRWIAPGSQSVKGPVDADPATIGVSSFGEDTGNAPAGMVQRHQRAIANLHRRVTAIERCNLQTNNLAELAIESMTEAIELIKKYRS